jgi:hypothetical protein
MSKKNKLVIDTSDTAIYNTMISEIVAVSRSIGLIKSAGDGRIDSAIKEGPFLIELKQLLSERNPEWEIIISPPRAACDIIINSLRINLKLSDCKQADNCMNKLSTYYSITGSSDEYPCSSNWNTFLDMLYAAKTAGRIKTTRNRNTEYHYLVKNKTTGEVLLKSIFDIHKYISNPSNDLQINWKNEFEQVEYVTEDDDYIKKVISLLSCIQKSVRDMINKTNRYADADLIELIK